MWRIGDFATPVQPTTGYRNLKNKGGMLRECVFLEEQPDGTRLCGIHEFKPEQCRTAPWWPETVKSAEAWNEYKRFACCPGMSYAQAGNA